MRILLVLVLSLLITACGRLGQADPTPTPTRTPTPLVEQPAPSATTAPTEAPTTEAPTVSAQPTASPATEVPAAEVSATETPVAEAPAADAPVVPESLWATLPAEPPVECVAEGDFLRCNDVLLAMNFVYPAWMGPVNNTMLREGGQAGYGYEYFFAENQAGAGAGGRSRDFAEGRGGMFTDQLGFGGLSAQEYCAQRAEGGICRVINEQVVVMTLMPQAFQFCQDWMMMTNTPRVIVAVDLPDHPLIHGFGFTALLLPPEMDAEWAATPQDPNFCSDEGQGAYNARMEALRQDLPAGVADPAIQARYDALVQLAESIASPFVSAGE